MSNLRAREALLAKLWRFSLPVPKLPLPLLAVSELGIGVFTGLLG
jgi:hypothetical protein